MELKILGDGEYVETWVDASETMYIVATKKFRERLDSLEKRIEFLEEIINKKLDLE